MPRLPLRWRPTARDTSDFATHFAWGLIYSSVGFTLAFSIVQPLRVQGRSMQPTLHGAPTDPDPRPWSFTNPNPLTSTSPALIAPAGDTIVVWKPLRFRLRQSDAASRSWVWRTALPLERGMVVSFASPWRPGVTSVKRVVGLPGDTVTPRPPLADGPADEASMQRAIRDELRDERLRELGRTPGDEDIAKRKSAGSGRHAYPAQGADGTLAPVTVPFGHVWLEGDNAPRSIDSNTYGPVSMGLLGGVAVARWPGWTRLERVRWQDDGWEARMDGRLKRRPAVDGELPVPEEWELYHY